MFSRSLFIVAMSRCLTAVRERLAPSGYRAGFAVLLASLFLAIAPAAQADSPSITVSPGALSPGGTVTVSGSGFATNSSVTISLDGTQVATPSTDSGGSFANATFAVPTDTTPGSHGVSATDGTNTVNGPITVDTVSVTPSSGAAGMGLTVAGGGWTPGDEVGVEIDGAPVCQLTADPEGNISGSQSSDGCQVPATVPLGSQSLTALDQSNDNQATGHNFTVDSLPPVPSFTTSSPVAFGTPVSLDASGSYDPDGTISTYSWDFGDGTSETGDTTPTTTHNYSQAGTYPVTLTLTDSFGNVSQLTKTVVVNGTSPTAVFANPGEEPTNTSLTFDGSASTAPDGSIASYDWNWGDGTPDGSGAETTHIYATAGTYNVSLTVTDNAGLTNTTKQTIVVDDRPPTASISGPTSGTVGSSLSFDGSSSNDPDGSIVSYDWNWGDGTADGTTSTPSHTYSKVGPYTVTLTVTDNSGNTDTVTHQVTITGTNPTASFAAPPEEPTDTSLSFNGSSSTDPNPGATITSYDWNWDDGTPDGSGANPTHSYATAGTYTVKLTVTDSAGLSDNTTQTVIVDDRPPVATFTPTSGSATVGNPVSFDGSSSNDPDGTITNYDWNWGDGTSHTTGKTSATPSHTFSKVGTYTVVLAVTDNSGNISTTSHPVTVTGTPPSAAFTAPAAAPDGTTLNFDGSPSSDPNTGASITSYNWSWGDGSPDSTGLTPTHIYTAAGKYIVTLTVKDSAGLSNSISHTVTVDDQLPVAEFTPTSDSTAVGNPVNFNGGSSNDPDGTITNYDWNWGDGTPDTSGATSATPTHTFTKVGTYMVILAVTDNSGNIGTTSHEVTVTGTQPTASFTPPSPQPSGTSLQFESSGSATPNKGATITNYDWNWGDGTADGTGAAPTHSYTNAGTYTVTLTVTDSAGETSLPVSHTVTVEDQGPVAEFTQASGSGTVGKPVNFNGSSSNDPGGKITSYDWSWGDGTSDGTSATPTHTFSKVGTYTVTLTVTDNSGNTGTTSHQVMVTGTKPTASFAAPPEEYVGTNLSFDGSGSTTPNQGAKITSYDWNWGDGTPDGSGAKTTHSYAKGGTYTVKLTVTDSAGLSNSISHTVTAAPTPIQTVVIVASPSVVKYAPPSNTGSGLVNLGRRLFCPGPGPDCTAQITTSSSALARDAHAASAGGAAITIGPDGSTELTFRLSPHARAYLRKHKHLPLTVTIVMTRGIETTTKTMHLTLHKKKG